MTSETAITCNGATSSARFMSLEAETNKAFNGIGPGIDVEVRTSPRTSIFMGFRAYHILGNRQVDFATSQSFSDGVGTGDIANARFSVEVDEWIYRLVVGFRLQWQASDW